MYMSRYPLWLPKLSLDFILQNHGVFYYSGNLTFPLCSPTFAFIIFTLY